MGKLTTHVLDTAHGCPAAGLSLSLYRCGRESELINARRTNLDGRLDEPLLQGEDFQPGIYELRFEAAAYFRGRGEILPEPSFVDDVRIRFGVADARQHHHVPLLLSPWSYTTYRGS